MLLWLLRGCYVLILIGIAAVGFNHYYSIDQTGNGVKAVLVILLIGGTVLLTDLWEKSKEITTISAVYFGLLLGLLLGSLFGSALDPFLRDWFPNADPDHLSPMGQLSRIFITLLSCYISISTLMQTKDEFRFIIPYVEFSKQVKGNKPMVLDTSVIIDGRIADLCDTRVIDTKLIVPRFVLQELQGIADSSDKLKRNRGRRGLDILKRLQNNGKVELEMHDGNITELRDASGEKIRVDERLVMFTKAIGGRVVTNEIAQLQGVDVINLNEVANSLKTVALPGEGMNVKVVKAGDQIGQGVGYLDDGTMVVIEHGRSSIGQEVLIVVTSVLQTPAGRMIFGRIEPKGPGGGGSSSHSDASGSKSEHRS
jgi:uncharacterized protein YacL